MPLTSQAGDWLWAEDFDSPYTHTITVQAPNVDTLAEIALYHVGVVSEEKSHSSVCYIDQIVSASGVENLAAEYVPMAFRRNVTSITFAIDLRNALVGARWMMHFYT
jgi:hypothetical protein